MKNDIEKEQEDVLREAAERARRIVNRRAALSAGATLLPVPGVDIAVDTGALISMLNAINRAFMLSPEQIALLKVEERLAVFRALGEIGAFFAGHYVTSGLALAVVKQLGARWAVGRAARWVPVIGQGAAAALSFAAFKWLGEAHIRECLTVRARVATLLAAPKSE